MIKGVDYSTRPADWAKFFATLKGKGYSFLFRYLYDHPDAKRLERPEVDAAFAAGLKLGFYFETSEGACLDGYGRGADHARRALNELVLLGLPEDGPVCFCIDIDASNSQLAGSCRRYFEGVRSILPLAQVGVYGGYRSVEYICGAGLASFAVQTEAWSRFNSKGALAANGVLTWSKYAQVRQWTVNGPGVIGGVACDGLDMVKELPLYHPTQGDDMTDLEREAIYYTAVRALSNQFDIAILEAKFEGKADEVKRLEEKKKVDVANERKRYGLPV
jgi:hypothetical protein